MSWGGEGSSLPPHLPPSSRTLIGNLMAPPTDTLAFIGLLLLYAAFGVWVWPGMLLVYAATALFFVVLGLVAAARERERERARRRS